MAQQKNGHTLTRILALIYLILLTWIILFKMNFSLEGYYRSINLIPFSQSLIVNGRVNYSEIIQNIIAFLPLGIYICMLKGNWPFWKKILPLAGISLFFETFQYILAIGATDITDFINNTLGGILGIGIYVIFSKLLKSRDKADRIFIILAIIGTACLICLLALLILANL